MLQRVCTRLPCPPCSSAQDVSPRQSVHHIQLIYCHISEECTYHEMETRSDILDYRSTSLRYTGKSQYRNPYRQFGGAGKRTQIRDPGSSVNQHA